MLLERARLIELPPSRLPRVAVNRERTDIDESAQGLPAEAGLEKIARCDNRVHKRVRERLFAGARGEMKDHPGILRGGLTVIARKKIAGDHLDVRAVVAAGHGLQALRIAGGS